MVLKSDSARTQQAPATVRTSEVMIALVLTAVTPELKAKPKKATRTIHSLDRTSRSLALTSAPAIAPTPNAPSMTP
ncbi:hypothetical protein D3C86_1377300 [compost metagenome]